MAAAIRARVMKHRANCWEIRSRRFKCQACRREFSVTTGTVYAFRKMSFQDILAGLWFSVNSVKGKSALQLSRELGVQYHSKEYQTKAG